MFPNVNELPAEEANFTSCPIALYVDQLDNNARTATAFFFFHNDERYLVTAWHCLTARDSRTQKRLLGEPPEPRKLAIRCIVDRFNTRTCSYEIELFIKGNPRWLIHPEFGSLCDVAVIPIGTHNKSICHAELLPPQAIEYENMPLNMATDIAVLGFPFSAADYPVWGQGTFAVEPSLTEVGKAPYYTVNAQLKDGFSGAPAYAVNRKARWPNGAYGGYSNGPIDVHLLGVFSGRRQLPSGNETPFSVVWPRQRIVEIIEAGTLQGKYEEDRVRKPLRLEREGNLEAIFTNTVPGFPRRY